MTDRSTSKLRIRPKARKTSSNSTNRKTVFCRKPTRVLKPVKQGGEIRISRGNVETNVGGEKTILQGDEFAAINNGKIASKEKLLSAPKLLAPTSADQIQAASRGTAETSFRWQNTEKVSISKYHLQVSTSPFFPADSMLVERDSLNGAGFSFGNIAPGIYYWRVRSTAASGQTSDWSELQKFTVLKNASGKTIDATEWKVEADGRKYLPHLRQNTARRNRSKCGTRYIRGGGRFVRSANFGIVGGNES